MHATEINQQKVLSSKELLLEIINAPEGFKSDETLFKALKSQGGLAKLEVPDKGIAVCSLNTLKSASDSLLDRGFIELDELRINARNALESAKVGKTTNTKTRTGLKHKVEQLKTENDTLKKSNFLMQSMVDELRAELKKMAFNSGDDAQIERYRDINKRLEAKLSFTLHGEV